VTALCSPTRAALLTGRNNHALRFGSVGEFAGGFPGHSATLPRDCAPLPLRGRAATAAESQAGLRTGSKIEESAGETIPIGGAGLIVAYKHADAETVEPAVTRAVKKVVGEADGRHVEALKGALADAQKKMAEDSG
jgi:hypothetical protein